MSENGDVSPTTVSVPVCRQSALNPIRHFPERRFWIAGEARGSAVSWVRVFLLTELVTPNSSRRQPTT